MFQQTRQEDPLVSVLLPVYNGEPYLEQAIRSICRQTYRNLEIIIINDGSTDSSNLTLNRLSFEDDRIRTVSRSNLGLVATLNQGLSLARGKYIARMDADDISEPQRIKKQVDYLESNPDVVLLGVRTFEKRHHKWLHGKVCGKYNCTWALLFLNYIGHPGVMFRLETVRANGLTYDEKYKHIEDYKFWCELTKYGLADVLNQPLLFYRRHDRAVSHVHQRIQLKRERLISAEQLGLKLGINVMDLLDVDRRCWVNKMRERIFCCPEFNALNAQEQLAIHVMFQEYSSSYGGDFLPYLKLASFGIVIRSPWFGARYLYRTVRYRLIRRDF